VTVVKERYEVVASLGSGGEAQIVKALDRQHNRMVALKIRPVRDAAVRDELLGEARVLLALPPHPALPLVREDFFDGDSYIVAMDWVDGTDLATLVADRGRPGLAPSSVLAYLAQAAEALTHLHSQSPPVIHGDVKPGNLILTRGGRITLVDFGLSSAPNVPLRRAGTPGYRAPELAAGGMPSRASDIYALAATAFALLTGAAPAGLLPSWDGIEPEQAEQLEAAIRLAMSTDPARRPATPGELVERLRVGWAAALPTGVVTFCFSDIEGSTALWDAHPEAMADALVRHDELIADAVEAGGGSLIESMGEGDSTVSVFASAPDAVAAALAANRALAAEEWPPGITIAARWGLHTGEAERRDGHYRGPTVSLAARLRAEADGGQTFLSEVTSELVAAHLPDGCSLVDLGPHRLKGIATSERIRALEGPGVSAPLAMTVCPYRGLLAFEPDDRGFFFGREEVAAEIAGRLAPGRLLAVVGASGSGKSSVLRAGIVAAVAAGEMQGLRRASLLTPGAEPALDVPDEPDRLVVVDQFEELFTVCEDADRRRAFIDGLLGLRCAVAIGVRADIYGRLSTHADLARAVAANQLLLGSMTAEELRRAITEPARLAGLKLEPGLVELVLRDVAAEPGALPLLSHALRATWERRDGRTLTVAGYRESGGVASAIARTADAVVDALPEAQRHLARGMFLRMAELGEGIGDTRRRVPVDELVPEDSAPTTVHGLLQRLADARLVTLDDGSAEVAHEALIREWPRLRGWLDEDRAGMRVHRQLGQAARLWDAGGREPSDLYRGARLASARELSAELNSTERAFIEASVDEADRERRTQIRTNRRLRTLLGAAALLLVLAVTAGALTLVQRDDALDARSAAEAQSLTSDAERVGALALSQPTLEQSLLLALTGVALEDRVETRGHLLTVLQQNPAAVRAVRLSPVPITAIAASPDGRLLASGDNVGRVRFTDLRTWRPSGAAVKLPRTVAFQAMRFAPDGRTVAVGTGKGNRSEVHVVDVATRQARRVGAWPGLVTDDAFYPKLSLAFAPDGRRLAVGLATFEPDTHAPVGQRLVLLDPRTGRTVWQRRHPFRRGQKEAHVLFGHDGALITSAGLGDTLVWNARTGRVVRRYPIGGRPDLAPDGRTLALARNSATLADTSASMEVLDLRSGDHRELATDLRGEWILGLGFTRDGTRIVGSAAKGFHVWDVASGAIVESYRDDEHLDRASSGIAIDRRGLAIFTMGDGIITAWDPDGDRRVGRVFRWGEHTPGCFGMVCSVRDPNSALMPTSLSDGRVALLDVRSNQVSHILPARDGPHAEALAFVPGGRRLATGGTAGTVTIWDLPSRAVVRRLRFAEPVWATAFSPDGTLIAVQRQAEGAQEAHVELRDLGSGKTLYTRTIDFGWALLAFSRDGRTVIASGCCEEGSTLIGWDARSGVKRFERQNEATFAVSPVGRTLAVGTADGRVLLLDSGSGEQRGPEAKVAGSGIMQIAFSSDGRLFAVAAGGAGVTLWDVRSRKRIGGQFPRFPGWTHGMLFEPDGRLLLFEPTGVVEWPTDRPTLQRAACAIAGRDLTREEWSELLPNRPYRPVCPD